jgi:hypothetical protein
MPMALASGSPVTMAMDLMGETLAVGGACLDAQDAITLMNTTKGSFRSAFFIVDLGVSAERIFRSAARGLPVPAYLTGEDLQSERPFIAEPTNGILINRWVTEFVSLQIEWHRSA